MKFGEILGAGFGDIPGNVLGDVNAPRFGDIPGDIFGDMDSSGALGDILTPEARGDIGSVPYSHGDIPTVPIFGASRGDMNAPPFCGEIYTPGVLL